MFSSSSSLNKLMKVSFILLIFGGINIGNGYNQQINHSELILDQTDTIAPTLSIFSPILGEDYTSTKMKITLEARDESAWKSLKITIGQIILFEINNTGETLTSQTLVYTNDFIFLDIQFILGNQPTLDNQILFIKLTDFGNNVAQESVNVDADLEKPIIQPLNVENDLSTSETSVTIKWIITDISNIEIQLVLLNGKEFDALISLVDNVYSFVFELAEPVVTTTRHTFSIVAIDEFGNTGRSTINVIFEPIPDITEDPGFDFETLIVLLGTILGFLVIVIIIVRKNSDDTQKDQHKIWEGELIPPPLLELMEIQLKDDPSGVLQLTDTFSRIENTWNDSVETMIENQDISNIDMSDFIDTFKSNLLMQLFNETNFTSEHFQTMEKIMGTWKSEIMKKSKKWKGALSKPPLEEIVNQFPTDKFSNYNEFVKTISVLLNSWEDIANEISQLEKPGMYQVKGILNNFGSETVILLAKTQEFSKIEINEIEKKLENWINAILH